MALPSLCIRPCRTKLRISSICTGPRQVPHVHSRKYAVVGTTTFVGEPPAAPSSPPPPMKPPPSSSTAPSVPSSFDARILYELRRCASSLSGPAHHDLPELILQYIDRSENVLSVGLPYESRPASDRRITFDSDASKGEDEVTMVVHAVQGGTEQKITQCSGFALNAPGMSEGEAIFVTCAHTLEEIRHSPILNGASQPHVSGSFLVGGDATAPTFSPVSEVLSALQRNDLMLLSAAAPASLRTLPVSPYPAHQGTPVRAHFVRDAPPPGADADGWAPWVGGTWSKWVRGTVVGYRDSAGREAEPGTYDAFAHLYFDPPPTPGSSGGPIVDEESGAVIGVMLGTQLQNRLEGVRGWGVPSELIFEMFRLPGLKLNR